MQYLAAMAALVVATDALAANDWKNNMSITSVAALNDGGFSMRGPAGTAPACNAGSEFRVQVNQNGQTAEGVKTTLALALAALSLGKTVTLLYDNANKSCFVTALNIDAP